MEITPDVPLPHWQEIDASKWRESICLAKLGVRAPDEYEQRPIVDTKTDGKWIQRESTPEEIKKYKLAMGHYDGKWTPTDGHWLTGSQCVCGLTIKDEMDWQVHTAGRVQPGGRGTAWFDPEVANKYTDTQRVPERIWRCSECSQPVGTEHKGLCHGSGMVTMAGERKVVLDAPTHILPCGHPPTAAGTCGIPWCDGIARVRDEGMGGDCHRQRDIRCSGCHQPFGSQHRPSCHRQGMVTSASDYDYMGAWIQPESGYDQRWCSFTDQMANLASGRAAGPGGRELPADAGSGHSASEGAKAGQSDGKAERP